MMNPEQDLSQVPPQAVREAGLLLMVSEIRLRSMLDNLAKQSRAETLVGSEAGGTTLEDMRLAMQDNDEARIALLKAQQDAQPMIAAPSPQAIPDILAPNENGRKGSFKKR